MVATVAIDTVKLTFVETAVTMEPGTIPVPDTNIPTVTPAVAVHGITVAPEAVPAVIVSAAGERAIPTT
jgi:hypothetical protein